jgi:hypothetical protein
VKSEDQATSKPPIELKDKLRYETLKALAVQGKSSFLVSIINGGIVFVVLEPVAGRETLLIWISILFSLTFIRVLMISGFFRLDELEVKFGFWQLGFMLLAYASAACWGVLPLLFDYSEVLWAETFVIFVISGMSAGALVSLYPLLNIVLPYLAIILFPLMYTISATPGPASLGMATLVGFYLLLLVRSAYTMNKSFRKTLRLELENEELFDFLITARLDPNVKAPKVDKDKFWQGYEK